MQPKNPTEWNTGIMSQLDGLRKDSPLLDIIGNDSYTKLLGHEGLESAVTVSDPTPPLSHLPPRRGLGRGARGGPARVPKKRSFPDLTKD